MRKRLALILFVFFLFQFLSLSKIVKGVIAAAIISSDNLRITPLSISLNDFKTTTQNGGQVKIDNNTVLITLPYKSAAGVYFDRSSSHSDQIFSNPNNYDGFLIEAELVDNGKEAPNHDPVNLGNYSFLTSLTKNNIGKITLVNKSYFNNPSESILVSIKLSQSATTFILQVNFKLGDTE